MNLIVSYTSPSFNRFALELDQGECGGRVIQNLRYLLKRQNATVYPVKKPLPGQPTTIIFTCKQGPDDVKRMIPGLLGMAQHGF